MNDGLQEFKANYVSTWAKAARNCQQVHKDLRRWFPDMCFPLGHGAISKEWENGEHEKGEVDIFAKFASVDVAGIEVTGSDKVNFPCEVWIGHHKIRFADSVTYPIVYVLFYNNRVRFCSADGVRKWAPEPQTRRVFGNKETYHILDPKHTAPYSDLKEWLEIMMETHLRKLGYGGR